MARRVDAAGGIVVGLGALAEVERPREVDTPRLHARLAVHGRFEWLPPAAGIGALLFFVFRGGGSE